MDKTNKYLKLECASRVLDVLSNAVMNKRPLFAFTHTIAI